jgi:hypothetical protein
MERRERKRREGKTDIKMENKGVEKYRKISGERYRNIERGGMLYICGRGKMQRYYKRLLIKIVI